MKRILMLLQIEKKVEKNNGYEIYAMLSKQCHQNKRIWSKTCSLNILII